MRLPRLSFSALLRPAALVLLAAFLLQTPVSALHALSHGPPAAACADPHEHGSAPADHHEHAPGQDHDKKPCDLCAALATLSAGWVFTAAPLIAPNPPEAGALRPTSPQTPVGNAATLWDAPPRGPPAGHA